ncbi:sialic acid-binding Ig-like lectin 10 [Archocentrus centrarchus]|uniref:sialic acid-binding Ig-like lectin 10 n=1 Tax=Archocentrus centrarchus TaxID=63155 RepID=UPI0011E9EAC1|nr:sialic acid-binding Ig-like lectin 10 [Archocentrus centrarchus]
MFVLIWAALLFSVRGSSAGTGVSASEHCDREYCVTLSEQELRAEAGLCVVISCSFRTAADFTPKHIVWFKCEASTERCGDADIIFHSDKNTDKKPQIGFKGRVSLLEPDVSQNNCSIIINDLKQKDSGSYQLRVNGDLNGKESGFTFITRVNVSVKGLIQKPTVMIPTLTEGQQATLTCTAPGLCSGSVPEITWTWRGAGGTESHITENITAFKTENLTAFTQRHTSTLTFDPSAEYHNTNVTCKINFPNKLATEQTSALSVNYMKEVKITGVTRVREGEALNLTCSVESFPPSLIMWKKLSFNTNLHSDTGSASLLIHNVTAEHSGLYVCTAKYMNNTLKDEVNITVIYKRKPQIIGNKTVKEGDVLNLTCSVESFPPSLIVWKKIISNTNLHNETDPDLHSNTGSSTLFIQNVTAEHSGLYICTAKHLDTTVTLCTNVTVTYSRKPQIIGDTTIKEGDVLNLTCSVESFPPALIVWKQLSFNTDLHSDTGSASLLIQNVTAEHSGLYVCTAKYMNNTLKDDVNITVIYKRKPQIIGNTTVKEGDVLNLTCSVESFPPALIVWKNHSSNTDHNDTGSSILVIRNVTAEHSGQYICTAKHLDTTVTSYVEVIVTWFSKILDGSGCVRQSEVLSCVCISEGFPLPTINWPLLKNHTEYSVITTVTNHTVSSTVSLSLKNHGNSTVECVSNNGNGEERENLIQKNLSGIAEQSSGFSLGYLKIIIAFLTGVLLSAIICLAKNYCSRNKRTSSQNSDQTSEMETRRDDQLVYYGQALRDHLTLNSNSGPTAVVYANINLSLLKRNPGREATRRQESTKTEYAEIKKALKEEQENDAVEEEEISCAKEEKLMVELEMKQCEPENKEGGDEAVYATVNDITDEI